MNKGMILMAAGLCLAGTSAAAQQSPSSAASAEAEAQRMEAAAAAMRQRAAALRQLEAANQALAAAQVPVPPDAPPAQSEASAGGADGEASARSQNGRGQSERDRRSEGGTQQGEEGGAQAGGGGGDGRQEFGGLEFGVGISFTLDVGSSDRVSEAEVINGIVRVKDENNGVARIMLESHYMFTTEYLSFLGVPPGRWGHGPFVALQPGTDDIIQAIGLGWMVGFRRPVPEGEEDSGQSFNLGLGIVVDPNARVLGEGIVANQPLPDGEVNVRYREEMQTGILALASFSF